MRLFCRKRFPLIAAACSLLITTPIHARGGGVGGAAAAAAAAAAARAAGSAAARVGGTAVRGLGSSVRRGVPSRGGTGTSVGRSATTGGAERGGTRGAPRSGHGESAGVPRGSLRSGTGWFRSGSPQVWSQVTIRNSRLTVRITKTRPSRRMSQRDQSPRELTSLETPRTLRNRLEQLTRGGSLRATVTIDRFGRLRHRGREIGSLTERGEILGPGLGRQRAVGRVAEGRIWELDAKGFPARAIGEVRGVVGRSGVGVFLRPDRSFGMVQRLRQGATVRILRVDGNWFEVQFAGTRRGWVEAQDLTFSMRLLPIAGADEPETDRQAAVGPISGRPRLR